MNISVVVPVYNRADVIGQALDSALNQTFPPLEVLVADDGSTDGTRAAVERYGDRVRYLYQENAGASAARNLGISQARGEWISFLDSDDEWLPHKLEKQKTILERRPDLVWCCCNFTEYSADGQPLSSTAEDLWQKDISSGGSVRYFDASLHEIPNRTSGYLIRTSVLRETGGFDSRWSRGEDRDLWWRIAMRYPEMGYCPDICWRYYKWTAGSLTLRGPRRDEELRIVCDNIKRARTAGQDVYADFFPYGRSLAFDFLMRTAGRQAEIAPEIIAEAEALCGLTPLERVRLFVLKSLPRFLSVRLANYFRR